MTGDTTMDELGVWLVAHDVELKARYLSSRDGAEPGQFLVMLRRPGDPIPAAVGMSAVSLAEAGQLAVTTYEARLALSWARESAR